MKIEVILKNVTPYHSSQPGDARVDLNGRFVYGQQGGFPCIRTRHMAVLGPRIDSDDAPKPHDTPIMPANSLRHALREALLSEIFDRFQSKYSLSIGAYAAAKSGNATGNPDGVSATFEEMRQISNHAYLGLFGGGPRMIPGKLRVRYALPLTVRNASLLPSGLEEKLVDGRITSIEVGRRVDPLIKFDINNAELVKDATSDITAYCNEQMKDCVEGDNSRGLNSFNFHETVVPGVAWAWSIAVNRPTSAQRGAILSALVGLHGSLQGGMGRIGYGEIAIESVLVDGEEVWGGDALLDSELVLDSLDAWGEALDHMSAAEFEAFAASKKAEKAEKSTKKTKKESA